MPELTTRSSSAHDMSRGSQKEQKNKCKNKENLARGCNGYHSFSRGVTERIKTTKTGAITRGDVTETGETNATEV